MKYKTLVTILTCQFELQQEGVELRGIISFEESDETLKCDMEEISNRIKYSVLGFGSKLLASCK